MIKKLSLVVVWAFSIFCLGCQSATVEKTAKPVVAPIQKTTEAVFKERSIGSEKTTQAIIFPKEQEEETKQFKIKF